MELDYYKDKKSANKTVILTAWAKNMLNAQISYCLTQLLCAGIRRVHDALGDRLNQMDDVLKNHPPNPRVLGGLNHLLACEQHEYEVDLAQQVALHRVQ